MLRRILLLLLAHAHLPLNDTLQSLQFPAGTPISIALSAYLLGSNLTFSVSGAYESNGLPIDLPQPIITQGLLLNNTIQKERPGTSNGHIGFVADPNYSGVYFDASENTISAWNLYTYEYIAYVETNQRVVGLHTVDAGNTTLIWVAETDGSVVTFEIAGFSASLGFEMYADFTHTFEFPGVVDSAAFAKRNGTDYCFVWGGDILIAYRLTLDKEIVIVSSITSIELGSPGFSPVAFVAVGRIGLVCDSQQGVFGINLKSWFDVVPPVLLVTWQWRDPTYYGEILDCAACKDYFYITTTESQLVYAFANTEFNGVGIELMASFPAGPGGQGRFSAVSRLSVDAGLVFSLLSYDDGGEFSMRVLDNDDKLLGYGFVLIDQPLCRAIDCKDGTIPAFTVFPHNSYDPTVVIIDGYDSLYVFYLRHASLLTFDSALSSSYTFTGTVTYSNSVSVSAVPICLTAWSITTAQLYTSRNELPRDGYLSPTSETRDLNSRDGLSSVIYLPLSNYLSGHWVQYTVSLSSELLCGEECNSRNLPRNVSLTLPDTFSMNGTYQFEESEPAPTLLVVQYSNYTLIVAANGGLVHVFDANETATISPIAQLGPFEPGSNVTQCTSVISLCSKTAFLVCESETGVNPPAYAWHIYDITEPREISLVETFTIEGQKLGKLQGRDLYLYSLREDAIAVFTLDARNAEVISEKEAISAGSLGLSSFHPIDFSTDFFSSFVLVYESQLGLIAIPTSTDSYYSFLPSGVPVSSSPSQVRLSCYDSTFLLLDPSCNLDSIYEYSLRDSVSAFQPMWRYPRIPGSVYQSAQSTYNLLGVSGAWQNQSSFFIFDKYAKPYRSLIEVLQVPTPSAFALVSIGSDLYHVFAYSGASLSRWRLGQSDLNWHPESDWIPKRNKETTVWAKIAFSYGYFLSHHPPSNYSAVVTIGATSRLDRSQTSTVNVSVTLTNSGSYIVTNPAFDIHAAFDPRNATGEQWIYDRPFKFAVSADSFQGADITFAAVLNGNAGMPLRPQFSCSGEDALVCIYAKEFYCPECVPLPANLSDMFGFATTEDSYFFSTYDLILQQSRADSTTIEGFNVTWMRNVDRTVCYLLETVTGCDDLLVAVCTENRGLYYGQFLLLLNVSNVQQSLFFELSSYIYAVEAVCEAENFTIFAVDFSRILVFARNLSELILVSVVSADSIGLDEFDPTSVAYVNPEFILVSDLYTGLFALRLNQSCNSYVPWQTVTGFKSLNQSGAVAISLSHNSSVFVLSVSSELYQFTLWDGIGLNLSLITKVPPLANDLDSSTIVDVLTVDETGGIVAFPVFDGTYCRVRVVNVTAEVHSRIYTSTEPLRKGWPYSRFVVGSLQIIGQTEGNLTLAALMAISLTETVFKPFVIRFQSSGVIFPQKTGVSANQQVTLQLFAMNSLSRARAESFVAFFPIINATKNGILIKKQTAEIKLYQKWWLWTIISIAVMMLFTAIVVLLLKYKGETRSPPNRSLEYVDKAEIDMLVIS